MSNKAKYDQIFLDTFEIAAEQLDEHLSYQSIDSWDSVGHMSLIAALEDEFGVVFEMDDIIDFGTYFTGFETMRKYGIEM